MSQPIALEFEVRATPEHAFRVWTEQCARWWPPSHCMSGQEGFAVVFEPWADGRIYEVGRDGAEYDWGRVLLWDPPKRVRYSWHIFLEPEQATIVDVIFVAAGDTTTVRLENSGFEVFGDGADERRGRVRGAWAGITDHYIKLLEED